MRFSPRHCRWIAFIALLGLLFQQLAMAAYVCPIEAGQWRVMTSETVPPCHAGVAVDKARCHQHCSPQPPSSDHPPMPTVPALLPATAWLRVLADTRLACRFEEADIVARAGSPPLTIRYCTFQI